MSFRASNRRVTYHTAEAQFVVKSPTADDVLDILTSDFVATGDLGQALALTTKREIQRLAQQLADQRAAILETYELSDADAEDVDLKFRFSFRGSTPIPADDLASIVRQLLTIDQLETSLRFATGPAAIGEIDFDLVQAFLGAEDRHSLERVARLRDVLAASGLMDATEPSPQLNSAGARRLARRVLAQLLGWRWSPTPGRHGRQVSGRGHERNDDVVAYVDDAQHLDLAVVPTMFGAIARGGSRAMQKSDGPAALMGSMMVDLCADDWRVFDHDVTSSTATVLLLDVSLSMSIAGTFVAAKTLAIALQSLITERYPRDRFDVVAFGLHAHRVAPQELATTACDHRYGTNIAEALAVARRLLLRHQGERRILLVTDGEPTAYTPVGTDVPAFSYPPVPEVLAATMAQVGHCTREQIQITTFVLDDDPGLLAFVRTLSARNGGRVVVVDPANLAERVVKAIPTRHGA